MPGTVTGKGVVRISCDGPCWTKGHDMAERIDEKIAWANRDLENMVWNMLDETYGDEIARSASIYVTLDGSGEAEVIHTDGSRKPEGTTKLKANGDVIKLKYIPEFNG